MTNPVRIISPDEAEERLREEYDLLCLGVPTAREIAAARASRVGSGRVGSEAMTASASNQACPHCAAMRTLVSRLVAAGIDWLDDGQAPVSDLEDDEQEIASEDDGVVDPLTLARGLR